MLWVEEYRPTSFDEIVGNRDIINEIASQVESGDIPHMAFFGSAGIGKTTTATVIAREIFGSDTSSNFLELNASDERGIDVVRNRVKKFAGRKTLSGGFKIVFLDEADSLTKDAQQALRRMMENYHETCRFILTGNYPHKLIKALHSRCSVYHFKPISQPECLKALERIAEAEDLNVEHEALEKLTKIYDGDLRQQIGKLQSLSSQQPITADELEAGEDFVQLYKYIIQPNFVAAARMANRQNVEQLYNYIMAKDSIPGRVKADLAIIFGKYMWRLDRSADESIQMNAMVAELIERLQKHLK